MKKSIVLILLGLLIMGIGTTAYAQVEFKAYGALFAGFLDWVNVAGGTPGEGIATRFGAPFEPPYPGSGNEARSGAWDRPVNFYSTYANIFFEWDVGKEIKGVFNIETVNYHSGTNTIPNGNQPPQGLEFDTGLWDTRTAQTRLRNAYVQFAVPYFGIPVPMTVTAGIIPMGTRPAFMWATTEGAGIQVDLKYDPAAFTFTWGKMAEGKIAVADDSNFFSLEGRANLGPATIGGYALYNNMNTYPITYNETAYGAPSSSFKSDMWWFGLYADGKLGPINFNFDAAVDTGEVKGNASAGIFTGATPGFFADDVKYGGWGSQLKITYPWEKFTFGGLGGYWSGSDLSKTSRSGFPGSNVAGSSLPSNSTKVSGFVYPAGDVQWVVWAESMFLGGTWASLVAIPQSMVPGGGAWNTQLSRQATGGTWVAKLFTDIKAAPWYKITLWGLYIGDTTKHGNTMGDAREFVANVGTTPVYETRDDKTIGWEVAVIQNFSIYKNLTFDIGLGYLIAGGALDQNVKDASGAPTEFNKSPHNPWMFSTKLTYSF
jgi:hypothetical protein